ncbi:MAG: DUF429 domain-containing protein [Acidobacteria bacterium]|nr:DUF429 domain-containing protein [Acidobacteriota bacterium]
MAEPATDQGQEGNRTDLETNPCPETGFSRIIGVDFATKDAKRGLVLATREGGHLRLERTWNRRGAFLDILTQWVAEAKEATLIAVDAPLGWPAPLGEALESHQAGQTIATSADGMFRRRTDDFVQHTTGKRPLEVGANLIARTAHAALDLLSKLGEALGTSVPLAWTPTGVEGPAAIEVYPAATLRAYGIRDAGYKKVDQQRERREIVKALRRHSMRIPDSGASELHRNADTLDAAVCVLAAEDFIAGRAARPEDQDLARREGWIWVRRSTVSIPPP